MSRGWRGASRPRRTSRWRCGSGWARSSPRACCGRCGSGRPRRTGPKSLRPPEADVQPAGPGLRQRYSTADVADPRSDLSLAWEALYRLEPELYERLVAAERLHPGVLAWLPDRV